MNVELKKRIFTSLFLLSLTYFLCFFIHYILISLINFISIIVWIEFYALISKILKKNNI